MKSRNYRSSKGVSVITVLVFGVICGIVGYIGYNVFPFYYYYYELQNNMESAIKVADEYDDIEIRKKLLAQIKRLGIPADTNNLSINRSNSYLEISLPYEEVFYITYRGKEYDLWTFKFFASAKGKF
jgi:hypothetical protein